MAVTWATTYILSGTAFSGLSNGNLTFTNTSQVSPWAIGSVGKKTGKWYWEYTTGNSTHTGYFVGVAAADFRQSSNPSSCNAIMWRGDQSITHGGYTRYSAATVGVAPGNGTVGVAIDCDTGKVWLAKNNSWIMSGNPANGTNPVADPASHSWWYPSIMFPAVNGYIVTSGIFASGSLVYTPPSGFSALTDTNDWLGNRVHCEGENYYRHSSWSGRYRVHGTIDRLGVPGIYRVGLFDRLTKRLLAETWSDEDGAYSFDYLVYAANGYFAIAYDHTGTPLNAAVSDLITPELMI